jgi:hypothetical protein
MTDLFLAPNASSEEMIQAAFNAIDNEELPPEVADEPVTEKVRKGIAKVACPECGKMISEFRMSTHVGRSACQKARADSAAGKDPNAPKVVTPRKPRSTPPTGKRINASEIITLLAGGVGTLVGMGVSGPTGMAIKLEAPLLGPELDALAAGTIVDKTVLQPIVRTKGKFDKVAPLVMFPALVFALDKNPAMLPQVYPMLRMTMSQLLPGLVAAMKAQAVEQEKMRAAAAELSEMDPEFKAMFAGADDPIEALINVMFAGKAAETPDQPPEPGSAWDGE